MAYGTINADVIQSSVTGVSLGAGNATRFKNRIINGNMVIDQRNAGASQTIAASTLTYTVDRFNVFASQASKFTVQQNAGSVTPPVGFNYYLGCTSSSAYSLTATDTFTIRQYIEGYNFADLGFGTANAKTITISFWVYSSLTGTFGGVFANYAFTRCYPFSYTISSANTWTQISVTIAGDTSGTWVGATNAGSAALLFSLGTGTTYSGTAGAWSGTTYTSATGATSVVGTSGATFYITGVQLEVGSSATGFEYVDYTTQLAMCQRYYFTIKGTLGYASIGAGIVISSTNTRIGIQYPVQMRTSPTASLSGIIYVLISTSAGVSASLSVNYGGEQGAMMQFTVASGLTTGDGSLLITDNSGSGNSFNASAEL